MSLSTVKTKNWFKFSAHLKFFWSTDWREPKKFWKCFHLSCVISHRMNENRKISWNLKIVLIPLKICSTCGYNRRKTKCCMFSRYMCICFGTSNRQSKVNSPPSFVKSSSTNLLLHLPLFNCHSPYQAKTCKVKLFTHESNALKLGIEVIFLLEFFWNFGIFLEFLEFSGISKKWWTFGIHFQQNGIC